MIRNAKIDANQTEIVEALRKVGAKVRSVAQIKNAFDILVFYRGQTFIVEIKKPKAKLTEGEEQFKEMVESVGVKYWIIRTVDEALEMIQVK